MRSLQEAKMTPQNSTLVLEKDSCHFKSQIIPGQILNYVELIIIIAFLCEVANLKCGLDWTLNHHRNTPLDISVRVFPGGLTENGRPTS